MKNKKLLSIILSITMFLGTVGTTMTTFAQEEGVFKNPLQTIQKKPYSSKKFKAKPLVILMDFPDYKHEELDKREKDFRINDFKGSETTPEFYQGLFFGDDKYKTSDGREHITVKKFFMEESGGTYEFDGKVVGWYTADKNAAEYGKNDSQWGNDQPRARELVKEAITKAAKELDLSEFDVEDKWDLNGNGNYNEPDGIIDSLVVIHPGLGEEWGGGSLGEDAIWPFRWGFNIFGYTDTELNKMTPQQRQELAKKNPSVKDKNGKTYLMEDFTVFEQDLPIDLFCHEFGHVLGLPDLYDVKSWADVPVENWSIMGGSYTGNPRGSQPNSYGAYCKEFLQKDFLKRKRTANWQKAKQINLSDIDEDGVDVVLDQASLKGNNYDAVRIDLPKGRANLVATPIPSKHGKKFFYSGADNYLENYMTTKTSLDLTNASNPKMTINAWYSLDPDFDFASVQVRVQGTDKWVCLKDTNGLQKDKVDPWVTENETKEEVLHRNPGWGFTGRIDDWTDISFDLSQYKGKKIDLRFRLATDSNDPYFGFFFDNLKVTDGQNVIFQDDAEGEEKFNFNGFTISDGTGPHTHHYLLEWRNKDNGLVDQGLGTINMAIPSLQFDTGLVTWYVNDHYDDFTPDQDVKTHPGEAYVTVVDADQNPIKYKYADGRSGADRQSYQIHDAAFSLRQGNELLITGGSGNGAYTVTDDNRFMKPVFDDSKDYTGNYGSGITGVKLQEFGLKVFVTEESKDRSTAKIHIARDTKSGKFATQSSTELKEIKAENGKLSITTDKEYANKIYANFSNINGKDKYYELTLQNGKYVCDAPEINDNNIKNIAFVVLEDKEGNARAIYNRNVNKVFGTDFENLSNEPDVPQDTEVVINNKASDFVKGQTTKVEAKLNLAKPVDEVTLLIGVYDQKEKMLSSSVKKVTGVVEANGKLTITSDIKIPNKDNIKVKVFLWDLKNMKFLSEVKQFSLK